MSRQAVYNHFGSKVGLFLAMVERFDATHGLPERIQRFMTIQDLVEALDAWVAMAASYEPVIRDVASAMYAARRYEPGAEGAWLNRMRSRRQAVGQLIARLAKIGRLTTDMTETEAGDWLWMCVSPATYEALVVERGWSLESFTTLLQRIARQTLLRSAP